MSYISDSSSQLTTLSTDFFMGIYRTDFNFVWTRTFKIFRLL